MGSMDLPAEFDDCAEGIDGSTDLPNGFNASDEAAIFADLDILTQPISNDSVILFTTPPNDFVILYDPIGNVLLRA